MDYKKNHNNMEFQFPNGNGCISANIANRLFKRNIRNWDEAMVGQKKKLPWKETLALSYFDSMDHEATMNTPPEHIVWLFHGSNGRPMVNVNS